MSHDWTDSHKPLVRIEKLEKTVRVLKAKIDQICEDVKAMRRSAGCQECPVDAIVDILEDS